MYVRECTPCQPTASLWNPRSGTSVRSDEQRQLRTGFPFVRQSRPLEELALWDDLLSWYCELELERPDERKDKCLHPGRSQICG